MIDRKRRREGREREFESRGVGEWGIEEEIDGLGGGGGCRWKWGEMGGGGGGRREKGEEL